MKRLVCESLQEFFKLNEDVETVKKLFQEAGHDENSQRWKDFEKTFGQDENFMDLFAKLASDPKTTNSQFDYILRDYSKRLKDKIDPSEIDKNKFTSFTSYLTAVDDAIEKHEKEIPEKPKEISPKEIVQKPKEEPEKLSSKPIVKPKITQTSWLGNRLWVYGVLIRFGKDDAFVKFGDHRTEKEENARKYAMDETPGKLRGITGDLSDEEDIDLVKNKPHMFVIFCVDVTRYAEKIDSSYVHGDRKGFDNYMRRFMPGKRKKYVNPGGGISLELHKMDPELSDQEIKNQWINAIKTLTKEELEPQKVYTARPFHKEMRKKIQESSIDKFLLGAATGSGKELATLETIINIHDTKKDLFNKRTIHVSVATIPSTELELFEELSKVAGMQVNSRQYTEFSRIKPYCTQNFYKGYMAGLSDRAQRWFSANVKVIKSVSEIKSHNYPHDVPILFGSFPDFGLKASGGDPKGRYAQLRNRIGILSIGEGHQFLSKMTNKLWPSIKKKYNFKFLLVITGTPYDFIFNETSEMYFAPNERTLFTRNDLYERKRQKDPAFQKYPDIYYYQLNISDVIEKMKKDERWEGDEHSFTYDKFFEIDKKTKKFKYEDGIVYFFRRLLGSDEFAGKRDPLNINNAPKLCEQAKRHIIVALPVGSGGISVHEYIPKLDKLLESTGANGQYNSLAAYEENLGEIKEIIDENKTPTMTLTCRKLLTGTNIPAWGSLIFLRPIGNSVKFFEQATGRIGRAFEDKPNVGVFLGDINNAMNLHVSVDEKLSLEKGENLDYSTIVRRTYDNYFFFGSKNGKWEKFDFPHLQEALQEASGEVDYRYNLCLNDPKPPKDFDLEFEWHDPSGTRKVDVTSSHGPKGKNREIIERTKQLKLEFDNAKDKEKWYRNMIKTHISKILIICLLKGFKTISQFSDFIKDAIINEDIETLDLIGIGAELIPQYIDDQNQIDIRYLNRWLDRIQNEASSENTIEAMKGRHETINDKIDVSKLSESIVFDPLAITDKICEKLSDELKRSQKILIIEKNGSFTYSVIKGIGYKNIGKLTLVILDPISRDIIDYIVGPAAKLIDIKYIKNINENINELLDMGKFDVVIGNPPFQNPSETTQKPLWPQFMNICTDITKDNGYVSLIVPKTWLGAKRSTENIRKGSDLSRVRMKNIVPYNLLYLAIDTPGKYFEVGSDFCYYILHKSPHNDEILTTIEYLDNDEIKFVKKQTNDMEIISSNQNPYSLSIYEKVINNKMEKLSGDFHNPIGFQGSGHMSKKKTDVYKYKCVSTSAQYKRGEFFYSRIPHPNMRKKKLIYSGSGYASPFYDDGKLGTCHHGHSVFVNDEKEANKLLKFFDSKLIKFIVKIIPKSALAVGVGNIMSKLPKIDKLKYNFTDKDVYQYFGLSSEEQNYVETEMKND